MSARRILLIDNDADFHRILHEQVSPYGFEIYPVAENMDALGHIEQVGPELIFIAVEEPDKLGYSLCSRAKKSMYKDLPIVLTTSTVPPSGFRNHRRLSVHADEYIDKRTMSSQDLVDKIDTLIGLGAPSVQGMDFPEIDELFDEDEGEKTRIAPPGVLMQSDMDVEDSASSPFATLSDNSGLGNFLDEDEQKTSAHVPGFPAASIPTQHGLPPTSGGPPPGAPPNPAPSAAPQPTAPSGSGRAEALDLGLDQVAEMASSERSGRREQPAQARVAELERENQRLSAELDKVRSSSDPGGASSFSRERELLNLREIINRKEQELNELRDEVDAKDRQILDGKGEIRQLQRVKTELDSKLLELEQRILAHTEQISNLEGEKQSGLQRIDSLEQEMADTRAQNTADTEAMKRAHAEALDQQKKDEEAEKQSALEQMQNEYEGQLAKLREESEQSLQSQESAHATAMADAKTEHEQALAEAQANAKNDLAEAQATHEGAMKEAASAHADEKAELEASHAKTVAGLEEDKRQLDEGLSAARAEGEALSEQLADAKHTIEERDQAVAEHLATIEERNARVAELEQDVEELEGQNTAYQDQILEAYKKIKSDEATVGKAKKALAVALTLLDDNIVDIPSDAAGESSAPGDQAS